MAYDGIPTIDDIITAYDAIIGECASATAYEERSAAYQEHVAPLIARKINYFIEKSASRSGLTNADITEWVQVLTLQNPYPLFTTIMEITGRHLEHELDQSLRALSEAQVLFQTHAEIFKEQPKLRALIEDLTHNVLGANLCYTLTEYAISYATRVSTEELSGKYPRLWMPNVQIALDLLRDACTRLAEYYSHYPNPEDQESSKALIARAGKLFLHIQERCRATDRIRPAGCWAKDATIIRKSMQPSIIDKASVDTEMTS